MKKYSGLLFALVALLLAIGFTSSAMAIPPNVPGPNDNQLICHNTQHHQLKNDNANDNQKGVIINVDPSSIATNPHIKHGDACIEPINQDPRAVAACGQTEPYGSAEECLGEPECSLEDSPFDPECCDDLGIGPENSQQCALAADQEGCLAACAPEV